MSYQCMVPGCPGEHASKWQVCAALDAGRVNAPSGTTSEPVATEPQGSAGESPAPIHRSSNPSAEIRQRMLADEELSEYEFDARAHRIALEAHEDRLKLWEDAERLTRERDSALEGSALATQGHARQTAVTTELIAERDRLKAALLELVACKALREKIDGELSACHQEMSPQLQAMENEYQLRKPLAWRDARAALNGEPAPVRKMSNADVDRVYGAAAVKRAYYETHDAPHCPTCSCGSAVETAAPQAPIAKVIVREDGPADVMLYAPGLPPGEHDLYCEPEAVAPMMREETKADCSTGLGGVTLEQMAENIKLGLDPYTEPETAAVQTCPTCGADWHWPTTSPLKAKPEPTIDHDLYDGNGRRRDGSDR